MDGHELRDWISLGVALVAALGHFIWTPGAWYSARRRDEREARGSRLRASRLNPSPRRDRRCDMEHEDGYCDRCGAELTDVVHLTIDGQELCPTCAEPGSSSSSSTPAPREYQP